jgi:glycosyltransferase involved in cell wall biosynthesis
MSGLPFVSVIVPVWNDQDLIGGCLDALAGQDYPADRFEVIVVDNGSTDGTAAVVKGFPFATLLCEPQPGSYHARNRGLAGARGSLVAFTDSDCVPDRGWLRAAVAAAVLDPDAAILAGRVELFRPSEEGSDVCENYERLFAFDQKANVASGVCVTANWVSPRAVMDRVGGFDGQLKSGGDADCARRIREQGGRIVYVPAMLVGHPARTRMDALVRKRRRVVGGRIAAERSHRRPIGWLWTYFLISGAQMKRAWRARHYSWADRLRLSGLITLLWLMSSLEILRIASGRQPRRA